MMSNARRKRLAPCAAALVAVLLTSGCASTFDVIPEKLGGLPDSAPARPAEALPTPNVYATSEPREVKSLSLDEQRKLGTDLQSLREMQMQRLNPPPPPPPPKKAAPAKTATKTAAKKAEPKKPETPLAAKK